MSNIEFDFLIPDQDVPFYIDENMKIKCVMYYTNEKYEQSNTLNNGNNSNNISSQCHYIRIFSEDLSITMNDLEKFIDGCLTDYKEYKKMQIVKSKLIIKENEYFIK